MTNQSCGVREEVRAAKLLRRTAFACVFSALLMPLSMTTATGQIMIGAQQQRTTEGNTRTTDYRCDSPPAAAVSRPPEDRGGLLGPIAEP